MADTYKTVQICAKDEFVEKKSRFIGHAAPAASEAQARAFIEQIRSRYWDASHHVYAYVLRAGGVTRFSDDGEPSGTAGMPVLEVIRREDVSDVVVVVTRYFGGTLLGAGGLIRAYAKGAKIGLDAARIITMATYARFSLGCDYHSYGKVENLLHAEGALIEDTVFEADVKLTFLLPAPKQDAFVKKLTELSAGTLSPAYLTSLYRQMP